MLLSLHLRLLKLLRPNDARSYCVGDEPLCGAKVKLCFVKLLVIKTLCRHPQRSRQRATSPRVFVPSFAVILSPPLQAPMLHACREPPHMGCGLRKSEGTVSDAPRCVL